MSDQQMAELYERVTGARSGQATSERVFLRGWNACIDFVVKQMRITCDEPVDEEPKEAAE